MLCAIITLVACGDPVMGPLERGGDAARRDLREHARVRGAQIAKDTAWLDALICIGAVRPGTFSRVDVFVTNEEGHDFDPDVTLANEKFGVLLYNSARGTFDAWPSAFNYLPDDTLITEPLQIVSEGDTMRLSLATMPGISIGTSDTLPDILFNPLIDSTISYSSAFFGDTMSCEINFDGSTSFNSSRDRTWKQLDDGTIVIPSDIRSVMKADVPNRIYLHRRSYTVTQLPNGKRIGRLRTRSYDNILLTRK